jgi:hypothetical protein
MNIKGEKVFTAAARHRCILKVERLAKQAEKEAIRLRCIAIDLSDVQTAKGLAAIDRKFRWDSNLLRPYYEDTRLHCHYCGRKARGGAVGFLSSDKKRAACWRNACLDLYQADLTAAAEKEREEVEGGERRRVAKKSRRRGAK